MINRSLLVVVATFMFASCFVGCSNKDQTTTQPQTKIMLIHAAAGGPDSIIVQAYNGVTIQTVSTSQPYLKNTGYMEATSGTYMFIIDTANQLDQGYLTYQILTLGTSSGYSFFLYDSSKTAARTFLVNEDLTTPSADTAHIRFFHLSPDAPAVTVTIGSNNIFGNRTFYDMSSVTLKFNRQLKGTYPITIYEAGTTNVLASLPAVELKEKTIYSLTLTGFAGETGKKAYKATLFQH